MTTSVVIVLLESENNSYTCKSQSNPINTHSEEAIESVRINRVSILTGLNLKKI